MFESANNLFAIASVAASFAPSATARGGTYALLLQPFYDHNLNRV